MTGREIRLGERTWREAAALGEFLLVLPLGSTEQHGPHLPLDTDTRIAVALAAGLAARRKDVVVAPALAYGSSGEHAGFAGTLSIGGTALELLLVELVRSVGGGFRAVVLLSWHGGNFEHMERAVRRLTAEGRRVMACYPGAPGGDAHAGRTETSLLLAIAPELVRRENAEGGNTTPVADLIDALRRDGVLAHSPNGVLGNPVGASALEGEAIMRRMIEDLSREIDAWLKRSD